MNATGERKSDRLSTICAAALVVSLALIEPALGRLERLGDALEARQYLLIMPTGELAYIFPPLRNISVKAAGALGLALLPVGLLPSAVRLSRRGLDRKSLVGWLLVVLGSTLASLEYALKGEWVILRRIGVRYLAMAMVAVGAFLGCGSRAYLSALGTGGFAWDLSSAVFWASIRRDPTATVPVPWQHHFEQEEGAGAPCWLVILVDLGGILFFTWLRGSDIDPLRLFDEPVA